MPSRELGALDDFRSEIDTQNAYLVTNLAYTLSITRIAHYVKRMMRDYIGSTADAGDADAGWSEVILSPARKIDLRTLTNGVLSVPVQSPTSSTAQ